MPGDASVFALKIPSSMIQQTIIEAPYAMPEKIKYISKECKKLIDYTIKEGNFDNDKNYINKIITLYCKHNLQEMDYDKAISMENYIEAWGRSIEESEK